MKPCIDNNFNLRLYTIVDYAVMRIAWLAKSMKDVTSCIKPWRGARNL